MKKLITVLLCLLLISCGSDTNENIKEDKCGNGETAPETWFTISFENASGTDLLNPNTVNGFKKSEIKVFSDSSLTKELTTGSKFYPLFKIYKQKNQYVFEIFLPSNLFIKHKLTMYLKLNDSIVDKIEIEAKDIGSYDSRHCYISSFKVKNLKYNEQLKYEYSENRYPSIVITKNNM